MMSANKLNVIHNSHTPTADRTFSIHSNDFPGGYDQRVGAALAVRHWYTGKDAWSIVLGSECLLGGNYFLVVEKGGKLGGGEENEKKMRQKRGRNR